MFKSRDDFVRSRSPLDTLCGLHGLRFECCPIDSDQRSACTDSHRLIDYGLLGRIIDSVRMGEEREGQEIRRFIDTTNRLVRLLTKVPPARDRDAGLLPRPSFGNFLSKIINARKETQYLRGGTSFWGLYIERKSLFNLGCYLVIGDHPIFPSTNRT